MTTTATWPASLPQSPLKDGYGHGYPDAVIRSPMDSGPPKTRPRFTRLRKVITASFHMTNAQKTDYEDFIESIGCGAKPFSAPAKWQQPGATGVITVVISAPLADAALLAPNKWRITIEAEVLR